MVFEKWSKQIMQIHFNVTLNVYKYCIKQHISKAFHFTFNTLIRPSDSGNSVPVKHCHVEVNNPDESLIYTILTGIQVCP